MIVDSLRSEEKKVVIRLVEQDFMKQAAAARIPVSRRPLRAADLRERFAAGAIPIVLVSAWRLTGDRQPHWIAISGFDDRFASVHDPYVATGAGQSETDCIGLPVPLAALARLLRLGRREHFPPPMVSAGRGAKRPCNAS